MIHIYSGMYSWYVKTTEEAAMIANFLTLRNMQFDTRIYERKEDGYFNVYPLNLN
jgi:hypothetical protein